MDRVRMKREPVIVQSYDTPQAVIIPYKDFEAYREEWLANRAQRQAWPAELRAIAEEVSARSPHRKKSLHVDRQGPSRMSVPRAVADMDVLMSYLLVHCPPIATLIEEHLEQGRFTLVSAPELLEELAHVLRYPRLQRYYDARQRDRFVALIAALSELVELPEELPTISRDAADDQVIACAVVSQAHCIVSDDHDLLDLQTVGGIPILTAAQFLQRISMEPEGSPPKREII